MLETSFFADFDARLAGLAILVTSLVFGLFIWWNQTPATPAADTELAAEAEQLAIPALEPAPTSTPWPEAQL